VEVVAMIVDDEGVATPTGGWLVRWGFWLGTALAVLAAAGRRVVSQALLSLSLLFFEGETAVNAEWFAAVIVTLVLGGALAAFLVVKGRGERRWYWAPLVAAVWNIGTGLLMLYAGFVVGT
jgi:hypothetical protein